MTATTTISYTSYTKKQLETLCKERKIKGISFKHRDVLIEMLMTYDASHTSNINGLESNDYRDSKIANIKEHDDASSTSSTRSHEYIFHADWVQVLPYLEDSSVAIIIADAASLSSGIKWMAECLRILTTDGTCFIRGMTSVPACIPKHIHTSWHTTERILALRKDVSHPSDSETAEELYTSCIQGTSADSTVLLLLPFPGESVKLVKSLQRPFIAMDSHSVDHLYDIIH